MLLFRNDSGPGAECAPAQAGRSSLFRRRTVWYSGYSTRREEVHRVKAQFWINVGRSAPYVR